MAASTANWRTAAACRVFDPDLFFPVSPSGLAAQRQVATAKEVCAGCQVRAECLEFALRTGQAHGVWGGMSEPELHLLRRHDARRVDRAAGDGSAARVPEDERSADECPAREPRGSQPAAG